MPPKTLPIRSLFVRKIIKSVRNFGDSQFRGDSVVVILKEALQRQDPEATGYLDHDRLQNAISKVGLTLTDEEARLLVREYDTKSGKLVKASCQPKVKIF